MFLPDSKKQFQLVKDGFINLLFPEICLACETELSAREHHICYTCWESIHLTYFEGFKEPSSLDKLFWGRVNFEATYALFYFQKEKASQKLLHALKYQFKGNIGVYLGSFAATKLVDHPIFKEVQALIPVPLHSKKAFIRGYNQSEKIAQGIASVWKIPVIQQEVLKTKHTESQTRKDQFQRWENVTSIFKVKGDLSNYQHVAIVDDVITTGSTLESMAKELKEANPSLQISIISLALAKS
jgi:ComF family protein